MEALTRICVIGPECTGKTTLAQRLAEHYSTVWVAEFARAYAIPRHNRLTAEDVEPIAWGTIASAESLAPAAEGLIILDTDLVSTWVYAHHYYGACPPWIAQEARKRGADLYLLMDTDVPWMPDEARDSPGDAREDLFDQFRATLDEFDLRWEIVSGTWDERFATACRLIDGLASQG